MLIALLVLTTAIAHIYLFPRLNPILDWKMTTARFFDDVLPHHCETTSFSSFLEYRIELYDVEGREVLLHVNLLGIWGEGGPVDVPMWLSKSKPIRKSKHRQILLDGEEHFSEIQRRL